MNSIKSKRTNQVLRKGNNFPLGITHR